MKHKRVDSAESLNGTSATVVQYLRTLLAMSHSDKDNVTADIAEESCKLARFDSFGIEHARLLLKVKK